MLNRSEKRELRDLVRMHSGGHRNSQASDTRPQSGEIVWIRNTSGAAVNLGGILGIDRPAYRPSEEDDEKQKRFESYNQFIGVEPTEDDHKGKFAAAVEYIPDGEEGRARIVGIARVRVYVSSPDDTCCDVIDKKTVGEGEDAESCYLGTGGSGAQILWMEDDAEAETIVWAIVRLGGGSGAKGTAYYQLLGALDCGTILALANPTTWDSENYQWKDEHSYQANQHTISPEWTVMVANTTRAIGAWQEDFITCQPLAETYETDYYDEYNVLQHGTFKMVEIVSRLSSQTTYVGYIPYPKRLEQGGFLDNVSIYVNGIEIIRTLHDIGLLGGGQWLVAPQDGTYVEVTYFEDVRAWCLTGAQCDVSGYL